MDQEKWENENKPMYEVMHLAKTGKIKAFRLRGFDHVFWYDTERKIFKMKERLTNTRAQEPGNLFKYIAKNYHDQGWYRHEGSVNKE